MLTLRLVTYHGMLLFLIMSCPVVYACVDLGTVRDSAFFGARDNYWVGMVFDADDQESRARYDTMAAWFADAGATLNIEVEHILPEDALYLRMRYDMNTAPPELPVTLFAGRHPVEARPQRFVTWSPAPEPALFERLLENETLTQIAHDTPKYWAVLLYAPGPETSQRAEIEATVARWEQTHPPGITLHEIDLEAPENKLLHIVTGLSAAEADWAGIVYGRGRLLMPPLTGADITTENLNASLEKIILSSSSMPQPALAGFDLPMPWDDTQNNRYVALEGPVEPQRRFLIDALPRFLVSELPSGERVLNTPTLTTFTAGGVALVLLLSALCLRLRT